MYCRSSIFDQRSDKVGKKNIKIRALRFLQFHLAYRPLKDKLLVIAKTSIRLDAKRIAHTVKI